MNAEEGGMSFASDEEVEGVLRGFESCALEPSKFGHREHLAVAVCYLRRGDPEAALGRVREGIYNFLRRHGEDTNVYSETVTVFWLRRVQSLLKAGDARTLAEATNGVLAACADSKVIYGYYSRELLATDEARASLVEPDLRPLDF